MPELRCDAETCVHNRNSLCDLDRIRIRGRNAATSGETSCDSFRERDTGNYSDCSDFGRKASPYSHISCAAKECVYNKDCECGADSISVEENGSCGGTKCATFQCK